MLANSIRLLSDMTDDAELIIQIYVGLEDFYTRRVDYDNVYDNVDANDSGFGDVGEIQDRVCNERRCQRFHGQPVEVALPEDVFVMPLAMMQQMNQ